MPARQWPSEVDRLEDENEQDRATRVFACVLSHRAPSDWAEHEILSVAEYAIHFCCAQRIMRVVANGSPVLKQGNGKIVKSPLYGALEHHQAELARITRRLSLNVVDGDSDARTLARAGQTYRHALGSQPTIETDEKVVNLDDALGGFLT